MARVLRIGKNNDSVRLIIMLESFIETITIYS